MTEPEAVVAVLVAIPGTQVVETTRGVRDEVARLVERWT